MAAGDTSSAMAAVQTLLNTVAISYISAKRGKEYFDNKDTAAPG